MIIIEETRTEGREEPPRVQAATMGPTDSKSVGGIVALFTFFHFSPQYGVYI